jgi:hypothetical protein
MDESSLAMNIQLVEADSLLVLALRWVYLY